MSRLIEADALKHELMKAFNCENATKYGNKDSKQQELSYSTIMLYEVADIIEDTIDNAPTVTPDMAQVLAYESGKASERPHGKWIKQENKKTEFFCSECGRMIDTKPFTRTDNFPFCHCGADMREEE